MPNVALRSFQSFTANDEILNAAVAEIKSAVKTAKASGAVQVVSLFRKGYRHDLQVGDIYVIPPAVCNSMEDFPLALLKAQIRNHATPEGMIEFEMGALLDPKDMSKETLDAFKDVVFREGEGDLKVLLVFRACWSSPYDALGFLYDEATVFDRLREVAYAAPFNPALSSVLDALKSVSDEHAAFVVSGPVTQHMFSIPAGEQDYPDFAPGIDFAAPEDGGTAKKASLKQPERRPIIRITAASIPALEKDVLSDQELSMLASIDDEVGATVVSSEDAGLRDSPLQGLITAAMNQDAPNPDDTADVEQVLPRYRTGPFSLQDLDQNVRLQHLDPHRIAWAMEDLENQGKVQQAGHAKGPMAGPCWIVKTGSLGQPDKTPATLPTNYPDGLYGEKEPLLADGQLKSAAEQPATYPDNDFGKGDAGLRARPDYGEAGSKETITPAMVDGPDYKTASIPGVITPMCEFGSGEGVAATLAEAVSGVGTAPDAVKPSKFAKAKRADDAEGEKQQAPQVNVSIPPQAFAGGGEAAAGAAEGAAGVAEGAGAGLASAAEAVAPLAMLAGMIVAAPGDNQDIATDNPLTDARRTASGPEVVEDHPITNELAMRDNNAKHCKRHGHEWPSEPIEWEGQKGTYMCQCCGRTGHAKEASKQAAVGEAHQVDDWTKAYGQPQDHTTPGSTTTQTDTVLDYAHPSQDINDKSGKNNTGTDSPDSDGAGESNGDMGGGTVSASAPASVQAAAAPETANAVRRFVENFGGHYMPLKALQAELARLTPDVKGAIAVLNQEGLIEPYQNGIKVLHQDLTAQTPILAHYVIRNASGQHWACAEVDGVKLAGFWTSDAEQGAHEFQNKEEANEEVRRNCLDREDGAIVLPAGIGPLKLASWWSPGTLLARNYPQLVGVPEHVPGKRRGGEKEKKADRLARLRPKFAGSWYDQGTVADQFAPDLVNNIAPNFQGELGQQESPDLINPFGAPGSQTPQAPVSMAGCPEGLNKEYDGVPLKQENNFYGPEFMREFYAPQSDVDGADLTTKQSAWKKAKLKTAQPGDPVPPQPQTKTAPNFMDALNLAKPEPEPSTPYIDPQQNGDGIDNPSPAYLMVDKLIKGAMGAYVSQLIGAFTFTQRPLELETPFEDTLDLQEVLAYAGGSSETASNAAKKQLTHALELLSDDEKKQVVNDGQAQAAVWCESSTGSGGYTYEVFARVEAIEGSVLTVQVITGIR